MHKNPQFGKRYLPLDCHTNTVISDHFGYLSRWPISPNMAVIKHKGHNPYTCLCMLYGLLMIWVNLSVADTIIVSRGDWLWKWAIFKAWDNRTTYTNDTIHQTRNEFAIWGHQCEDLEATAESNLNGSPHANYIFSMSCK